MTEKNKACLIGIKSVYLQTQYRFKCALIYNWVIIYTKKGYPNVNESGYRSAWKNSNRWLDKYFHKDNRKKMLKIKSLIFSWVTPNDVFVITQW